MMPRHPAKNFPEKPCKQCGKLFKPIWYSHKFCGAECQFDFCVPERPLRGCHNWVGTNKNGYGMFAITTNGAKNRVQAHRFSWERANGPIPTGLYILHDCDNPACVNPAHLRPGTQRENMADASARGRTPRGSKSGTAKLTEAGVRAIKAELQRPDRRLHREIAAMFGVHRFAITEIKRGSTWAWLK